MRPFKNHFKTFSLLLLMLLTINEAKADYPLYDYDDYISNHYKDCSVKLSSPSSAQGVVYLSMGSRKPYNQTGPAQSSTLKGNFEGSSSYQCILLAYPKDGYVLDGFVQKSDYLAKRTSHYYYLKDSKGNIYRSGDFVPFAKTNETDPTTDPTTSNTYKFSEKESVECYAIFRKATSQTINVINPGELEQKVQNSPQGIEVDNLIVKGTLNEADFNFLKKMINDHHLVRIDLSGAKIKEIPDNAFKYCHHLYEIKLPSSGLLRIGKNAFSNCRNLKSFTIPKKVSIIADDAFDGCISRNLRF